MVINGIGETFLGGSEFHGHFQFIEISTSETVMVELSSNNRGTCDSNHSGDCERGSSRNPKPQTKREGYRLHSYAKTEEIGVIDRELLELKLSLRLCALTNTRADTERKKNDGACTPTDQLP